MKIYIIAGEQSGDFIGGKVIKALKCIAKVNAKQLEILGIGGAQMQQEGLQSLFPIEQINLMGFVEVIPHIFKIKKLIRKTIDEVINSRADVLLTIDSPGFTYRVAREVRKRNPKVRLMHIVAPSVWAYKPGRAMKYAEIYNHLFTLLPFEPKYFEKHGLECTYIGHPILEQSFYIYSNGLKSEMELPINKKVISITPGSRKTEIKRHMPIICETINRMADTKDIVALFIQNDESNVQLISDYLKGSKFTYLFTTERLKAFAVSDVALAKSGTNTLEIAASKTPLVVGYKMNNLTYSMIKIMLKIRYVCLINIVPDREIIPEYIQTDFTADNLSFALSDLLNDKTKAKSQIVQSLKVLREIGLDTNQKPTEKVARMVLNIPN